MNKTLLAVAVLASTVSSATQAQYVSVNQQDLGICGGSPLSTFDGWVAVAAGRVCSAESPGRSSTAGTVDWALVGGPVEFDFDALGIVKIKVDPPNKQSGDPGGNRPNGLGPEGDGPPGNGPHGSGPPGVGPAGNGPPGVGPDGNGPPGPPDNNGNANNADAALDDLVNQTNATPEPATLLLVATGLGGVGALARRRSKRRNDEA